jgi:hypothetical protein
MLLLAADKVSAVNESQLPSIEDVHQLGIPETSKGALLEFVRQIGDVDIVKLPHYTTLHKGGNKMFYSELSDEGKKIFKNMTANGQISYDPVDSFSYQTVKVNIGEKEFFIASPLSIIMYKAEHFLQQSYNREKVDKLEKDMLILMNAMEQIYSWDEIVHKVHDLMLTNYSTLPNNEYIPF